MSKVVAFIRSVMFHVAGFIDYWTKGKIKPSHITALSLAGHVPVALALIAGRPVLAAVYLAIFAGLDALDGSLARVQGSSSRAGMFFDAVSDRAKEVILYSALAVFTFNHLGVDLVWQIVALCGSSLLVSYTKAKGEMAVSGSHDAQKLNRLFGIGIASYEIRMVVVIIGLVFNLLSSLLPLLIALNSLTIAMRFLVISKYLNDMDASEASKGKRPRR